MPRRGITIRADVLLRDNIRDLLDKRGLTATALAAFCNHEPAWISKILSGERNVVIEDLDLIAAFFGIQVADLFRHGVSFLTERRTGSDRRAGDRRSGAERRQDGTTVKLGQHQDNHRHETVLERRLSLAADRPRRKRGRPPKARRSTPPL